MNRDERRRTVNTGPGMVQKLVGKAFELHQARQFAAAEAGYREALRREPGHADATRLLGEVLIDRGQASEAATLMRGFIGARPGDTRSLYTLANALRLSGQLEESVSAYGKLLERERDFTNARYELGIVFRLLQREVEAAAAFRICVAALPGWAPGWRELGTTLAVLGDLDGAATALQRAVTLAPAMGEAVRALASLRPEALCIAQLEALGRDMRVPAAERTDILFALGRRLDAEGAYEAAFKALSAANALVRAIAGGLDRARLAADVSRLIAAFPEGAGDSTLGDPSEEPVFILGMPRAGSSLFEQIAASHPAVYGAGELNGIGTIAAQLGEEAGPEWTRETIGAAASGHLAWLRANSGGARRIIDKMPDNVFQLGLIATLFPNARVIFCARDRRDVALSCFFQHFSRPLRFDTDLDDCAFRTEQVERLISHWRQALPLRSMVMSYEALLAAPEAESRRLIDFLGLDWEPACLEFHKTKRAVRTASWSQVRQELYTGAAGRWRHYAAHLPAELHA